LPQRAVTAMPAPMRTLVIEAGRKDKLRAGDVVGAITGDFGFEADQLGKITVGDRRTSVAVAREVASEVLKKLQSGKVKGRSVRARYL
jgi:ATP-independent RNA helicase DbpA